jgi:predicted dehydrogenase
MDKVGIGFIGTGFARKVQMPAFAACEGAKIASIASGNLENARSAAKEFGAEHYTADWRETIAHSSVDLVCITTPTKMHREMTLFAIEHGKHILCEKPMAMNVVEAEEMTNAAAGKPLLALIDHELRFQPGRASVRQLLRDGKIGKVRHVKTIFKAPHRGDPNVPWNWWSDIEAGGGALGAINSHVIDSLHWFLGTTISSVSCRLHTNIKSRPDASGKLRDVTSDDEANMLLQFADGELTEDATGLVSVSMVEGPGHVHRIEFYGALGALRVDHDGSAMTAMRGQSEWSPLDIDLGPKIAGPADPGFARAFWFFAPVIVDALKDEKMSIDGAATFADGLAVQRVLDAARRSDSEDIFVRLD